MLLHGWLDSAAALSPEAVRWSSPAVIVVGRGGVAPLLVSALAADGRQTNSGRPVLRAPTLAEAREQLTRVACDELIIADPHATRPTQGLTDARGRVVRLLGPGDAVERLWGRIPLDLLASDPRIAEGVSRSRLSPGYRRLKRAGDLAVAIVLGLALGWLVPILALLIRLDSPGPVLTRRPRLGQDGRPFALLQFRTMSWSADAGNQSWTRVGRGLRATRLDRLPVLWNLLLGDLSLVGPEAVAPLALGRLEAELLGAAWRLRVPPGLTGWAQLHRRQGEGLRTTIEHDLYYVRHASLGLDLQILAAVMTHSAIGILTGTRTGT